MWVQAREELEIYLQGSWSGNTVVTGAVMAEIAIVSQSMKNYYKATPVQKLEIKY